MRMMGILEAKWGCCCQAKHVRGVDNRLADGLTWWDAEQTPEGLNEECPEIAWQVHDLGDGERRAFRRYYAGGSLCKMCSFDSKGLRGDVEDVSELEVVHRQRVLVEQRGGEDGTCGRVGRVYRVLLRGEREQEDDNCGQAGGD